MAPRKKSITPKYFGQGGVSVKIPRIAYTANALRFQSEEDLEIYIENHFDELFPDLELLQRQFRLKTNRYDLLCRHKQTRQAVILELKNEEDRSIIWQLVRYRKLIIAERPFSDQIDYSCPVELIAIAPSFHEDSWIDKEACKFEENIKLLTFSFVIEDKILDLAGHKHTIPYSISGFSDEPTPEFALISRSLYQEVPALSNFLSNLGNQEYQNDFWNLRNLFLAQPKVKEIINPLSNKVFYATSTREGSKTLAEINILDRKVLLFLHLPMYHSSLSSSSSYRSIQNPIKLGRFIIISIENSNLLNLDSRINYLVIRSSGGLSLKEKENVSLAFEKNRLKSIREGMPKWIMAEGYISILSYTVREPKNPIVFKELYPDLVSANPTGWWQEFQTQETDKLGWFVDLAIRAWRYKI
ncbi:hypothetical protein [Pseudanabaena sp. UWO310]|uniref:hypothetical protein n=1 Tax=Pseudanabaena sp. UWO310 TaxID=2480795 RepID=UPI00115A58F5|nr:hypothetical protein [Pseudanabaena sp. UWO310]TYQ28859.1 hypothetical protein PseudUWO310_13435 [Pseudanabaena sp. UWO310]